MRTLGATLLCVASCVVMWSGGATLRAQNAAPAAMPTPHQSPTAPAASSAGDEITRQTTAFYRWYVHALNQNQNPLEGKLRAELRRYVSKRLLKEIDRMSKGPDGLDGDYFIDAQDWDKAWEQNITVKDARATSGAAGTAEVTLSGPELKRRLQLRLVREDGAWKVDRVKGVD